MWVWVWVREREDAPARLLWIGDTSTGLSLWLKNMHVCGRGRIICFILSWVWASKHDSYSLPTARPCFFPQQHPDPWEARLGIAHALKAIAPSMTANELMTGVCVCVCGRESGFGKGVCSQ